MSDDPAHFLSCKLLMPLARVRHDRLVRLLATLIQRAGGAAYVEPRYLEDKRPDIHALMHVLCWMFVWPTLLLLLVFVSPLALRFYRENGKISAYEPLAKDAGSRFGGGV